MNKRYKNSPSGEQIILIEESGKQWWIPFDENNTHYKDYLVWVAEGNTPEPADQAK